MKKEISWKGLVKQVSDKHKKSGKSFDFKNVLRDAGDEWEKIKAGNHPDYVVGKSAPAAASTKRNGKSAAAKTMKKNKKSSSSASAAAAGCDMKEIMSKCKLCKSCQAKVKKVIGGQSGGKLSPLSPDNYAPAPAPAQVQVKAPAAAPAPQAQTQAKA
jgi:hypothetical protein